MITTYLFLPMPTDEAILFRKTGKGSLYDQVLEFKEDMELFPTLLADPKYASFCKHRYGQGLPLKSETFSMHVALNYGPGEPAKGIFFDTLDLDDPSTPGQSGYGYFTVSIVPGSESVLYTVGDGKVSISCVVRDDSGLTSPLACAVPASTFLKALIQLDKKTKPLTSK